MRIGRVLVAVGLVGVLSLTSSAHTSAQEQASSGLSITPARVEEDIATESALVRVTVRNDEPTARTVTLDIGALTHDLEGVPQLDGAGPEGLSVRGNGTFEMQAGESRQVEVDVPMPAGQGGRYFSVRATVPAGEATGATVRYRVASLVLLRPPSPWNVSLALDDVEIRRRAGDGYVVSAIVRNTGDVHVRPSGRIEMATGGAQRGTVSLDGETILPGAARRLSGTWTPAGEGTPGNGGGATPVDPSTEPVDATVILTDPDFTGSKRARFVDEVVTDDGATDDAIDGGDGTSELDLGAGADDSDSDSDDDGLGGSTVAVVIAAVLVALMGAGIGLYALRRRASPDPDRAHAAASR